MELHEQLLEQARHLATRDRRRPQQGNLRRALSTAYYALFHFLVDRASRFLVGSTGDSDLFRKVLSRAFIHSEMAAACKSFRGGTLPGAVAQRFGSLVVPKELRLLAATFCDAQQLRHLADYDLAETFQRNDVLATIDDVAERISDWDAIKDHQATRLFLLLLLTWDRIAKR